ncbi:SDR family oxidoreductase [Aquimarina algicola]|uniref:SDR family oxidoreductase n=1 Tax=Aquimarina algicola TaxID=2589995 RepID=A0A504JJC0_9FLAO|nr:SDR family oxidoreductase [Aquimarina algicola]TPN88852.1 SDR family oxidoreductase [Aquimarina algicola]
MDFEGKNEWAIILGGSTGLGIATAKKLAFHGMNIIIIHRNRKSEMHEIESNFANIRDIGVQLLSYNIDLLRLQKRNEVAENLLKTIGQGKIKALIHSVAKGNLKPMVDEEFVLKNDDFHLTIDAMAISLYDWVKTIFDHNLFAKKSTVLSFTSEGSQKAWKHYAAVSAAKAALETITRSIALEFAPHGITANCLQPGAVDTQSLRMIPEHQQIIDHSVQRNPFNRITQPEDVANVVYLLCKDEASWINGCVIPVNGGEHLN